MPRLQVCSKAVSCLHQGNVELESELTRACFDGCVSTGRTDGRGEGFSTGAGEEDNIPGQGLDGGPGGEDIQAAQAGRGEGLSAGNRGSDRPGGGVSLNAGRDEEFNNSGHKRFFDAESRVQGESVSVIHTSRRRHTN